MGTSFSLNFPEDFLSELLDTEFDEIAEMALMEAKPLLEASIKRECKKVIQHEGESELVESVTAYKPKKSDGRSKILPEGSWYVNVRFSGYSKTKTYKHSSRENGRKYQISNMLKAFWKEYGIPGRQPPRPFMGRAADSAEDQALKKMQEVYNRKVGAK